MIPFLSIVVASYSDNAELKSTVDSIRATSPADQVEIVVVDDASASALPSIPSVRMTRNTRRIGCGPSRYLGALRATGRYLMFCDSHMRFEPGWFANSDRFEPKVLHCGSCLGLGVNSAGFDNMDVTNPNGVYFGATFNFHGPDRRKPKETQFLECVWMPEQPGDEYKIPAIMGACYVIQREWFFRLGALRFLRRWGGDEQQLSLKAWLAGGEIRLLKKMRIGHRFRNGPVSSSFVMPGQILYNKLFVIHTCLPPEMANRLLAKIPRSPHLSLALKSIQDDWHLVAIERAYNEGIFERSFQWFLERFALPFP